MPRQTWRSVERWRSLWARRLLRRLHQLAGQRGFDELAGFVDAVEGDERAEARALIGAKQHLIDRAEPVAQRIEAVRVADRIDDVLQFLGVERVLAGELIVQV